MRLFELHRDVDTSGISGTGRVAQGIIFDNGKIAMTWLTKYTSVATYDDLVTLENIHGHQGNTRIVFLDESVKPG